MESIYEGGGERRGGREHTIAKGGRERSLSRCLLLPSSCPSFKFHGEGCLSLCFRGNVQEVYAGRRNSTRAHPRSNIDAGRWAFNAPRRRTLQGKAVTSQTVALSLRFRGKVHLGTQVVGLPIQKNVCHLGLVGRSVGRSVNRSASDLCLRLQLSLCTRGKLREGDIR